MENQVAIARLLVIGRDSEALRVIRAACESNLWQMDSEPSVWGAMEKLQSDTTVDALLIDLPADDQDGFRCLHWLRELRPELPILLVDRANRAEGKLHSTRIGKADYLIAPLAVPQLQAAIYRIVSTARNSSATEIATPGMEQFGNGLFFIGASPKMHRVTAQVAMLAEGDLPVFISGEPGSGKGMIARLLHQLSARAGFAFARVDCGSLSDELLEQEIFGSEFRRDATAARTAHGKLELSAGGTLFLDQIDEMPLQLQSRLASAMESGYLIPTAGSRSEQIDVRVVAASSRPIDRAIAERRIAPELCCQFNGREVRVPPLRERKEELPMLARHYMHQLSRQFSLAPKEFSVATERAWQSDEWPGNLRQLKQVVTEILIEGETACEAKRLPGDQGKELTQSTEVAAEHSLNPPVAPTRQPVTDIGGYKSLRSMIRSVREESERIAITSALEKTSWNRKAAARLLKVSYRSILYKIEQYQLSRPDQANSSGPGRFSPKRSKPTTEKTVAQFT